MADKQANRYSRIMSELFAAHYRRGKKSFTFAREEIEETARKLGIKLPKNLGDVIYSFRYRTSFPSEITKTAPPGFEWHIEGAGRSQYRFQLVRISRIVPSDSLFVTKIPDATPEIIAKHALRDEQALLAKVRYNRLIDIFLRITAFSLQNHLRTTVPNIGQIETDEIYVGVRNTGQQFIVPVQAKSGSDQIATVQVRQDIALCKYCFPALTQRPVAVQFKKDEGQEVIVMFELVEDGDEIKVIDEKQYLLVSADSISERDLEIMAKTSD